jgi:ATP-dependent helicase/nuclease subunit A
MRFISAGAGSGKTHRLTVLLGEFLGKPGVRPGGVIATTFTNKAAAELRERVRGHLVTEGRHALATAIGQARIGTVNSVCGGLLTRFAFEAGLPPEQRVLDETQAAQTLKEARDMVLAGPALPALLEVAGRLGLNEKRFGQDEIPWEKALQEIISLARSNGIDGPALRACGTENADRLLALFPTPSQQDLDAALRGAIAAALPAMRQRHAANARQIKLTADCIALLESEERALALGQIGWTRWCKLANSTAEKGLAQILQPVCDAAAWHSKHPRLHADLRSYLVQLFDLAARTLSDYADRKRQLCAVDFADQERLLLDILDEPGVVETLGEEIDLLMVDEFQDTSPIQLALFLKLARLATHVVWVGDVKQAIYGFRGGDAELMRAVMGALKALDCQHETLPHSYRSRPSLVALVNDLFTPAFAGMAPAEITLRAKRQEYSQAPCVEDWLLEGNNAESHHEAIASGIASLLNESFLVVGRDSASPRPIRLGDIALLARSRGKVAAVAAALQERQIAAATEQAGLLSRPEIVLALACLRRLNDDRDTIATAEIVSLAHCEYPDDWLSDRLAWVNAGAELSRWRDTGEGDAAPLFAAIQELRIQRPVLSPREAVELVVARCGLSRHVLQWQTSIERGQARLVNLDRLLTYASDYESDCRAGREAATLSGFLLWTQDLAGAGLDLLPGGGGDAVHVMTHHAAKGLEWPVVILMDLAGDVRDSLWDSVRAESRQAFEATNPLRGRRLRHWPWPYAGLSKVPLKDDVARSATGVAMRAAAIDEHKRVLYVSLTRARDLIVLARPQKDPDGEWMGTIGLGPRLPADGAVSMTLADGTRIPFRRRVLHAGSADLPVSAAAGNLRWFARPVPRSAQLPLIVTPSDAAGSGATVIETVRIGSRIDTARAVDREVLGMALHACIAADLVAGEEGLPSGEVGAILGRFGMAEVVEARAVQGQIRAIRAWIKGRWAEGVPWVEVPVMQVLPNGQRIAGQIDLLLRLPRGWILLDHKSTPQGQDQWAELAAKHGGQLAAYRETVEAVTGVPVSESWLVLPVAGAAARVGQG